MKIMSFPKYITALHVAGGQNELLSASSVWAEPPSRPNAGV